MCESKVFIYTTTSSQSESLKATSTSHGDLKYKLNTGPNFPTIQDAADNSFVEFMKREIRNQGPIEYYPTFDPSKKNCNSILVSSSDSVKIFSFAGSFTGNGLNWAASLASYSEGLEVLSQYMALDEIAGNGKRYAFIASTSGGSSGSAVTFAINAVMNNENLPVAGCKETQSLYKTFCKRDPCTDMKEESNAAATDMLKEITLLNVAQTYQMAMALRRVALVASMDSTEFFDSIKSGLYNLVWGGIKRFFTQSTDLLFNTYCMTDSQTTLGLFGRQALYGRSLTLEEVFSTWYDKDTEGTFGGYFACDVKLVDEAYPKPLYFEKMESALGEESAMYIFKKVLMYDDVKDHIAPSSPICFRGLLTNALLYKYLQLGDNMKPTEDSEENHPYEDRISNFKSEISGSVSLEKTLNTNKHGTWYGDGLYEYDMEYLRHFCHPDSHPSTVGTPKEKARQCDPLSEIQLDRFNFGFAGTILTAVYENEAAAEKNVYPKLTRTFPTFVTDLKTAKILSKALGDLYESYAEYANQEGGSGGDPLVTATDRVEAVEDNLHYWAKNIMILVHEDAGMLDYAGTHEPDYGPLMRGLYENFGFKYVMNYQLYRTTKLIEISQEKEDSTVRTHYLANVGGYVSQAMTGIGVAAQMLYMNNVLKQILPSLMLHPVMNVFSWKQERNFSIRRMNDLFRDKDGSGYKLWMRAHKEFSQAVGGSMQALLTKYKKYREGIGFLPNEKVYARVNYLNTDWKLGIQSCMSVPWLVPGRAHIIVFKTSNDAKIMRLDWFTDLKDKYKRDIRSDLNFEGWWSKSTELHSCGYLNTASSYQAAVAENSKDGEEFDHCVVNDFRRYAMHMSQG
eukprot:Nk52_evm11s2612 gene=Nk52_evmTU11s2612